MSDETPGRYSWRDGWLYWKMPVLFGAGFTAAQLLVAFMRFGFAWSRTGPPGLGSGFLLFAGNIVSGLLLFIPAGVLAGLLLRWFLRGSAGRWRIVLIGAVVVATPVAVMFSLVGGLLGPPGVVIGATAPYLIIVGIPALLARLWQHRGGFGSVDVILMRWRRK